MIAADLPPAHVPFGAPRLGVLVARQQWPNNPCNGHEQVMVSRTPPPTGDEAPPPAGFQVAGRAYLAGQHCLIWIRPGMGTEETCQVIVHEAGHWANGPGHTAAGVMAATVEQAGRYRPCEVPGQDPNRGRIA